MNDDRKLEDGVAVIAYIILMVLISLSLLVSCKTKEEVNEIKEVTVYKHDTLVQVKSDTVTKIQHVTQKDTVFHEIEKVITLSVGGDTVKEVTNNNYIKYVYMSDSSYNYKAIIDSIAKAAKSQESTKQEKAEKKVEKRLFPYKLVLGITLLALIVSIIMLVRYKYIDVCD